MAELKTKVNDINVKSFIATISVEQKQKDSFVLLDLFTQITGEPAKMWGSSIIGFGQYHYKSERSSQEGDWPLTAFSPRKQSLTLYVMNDFEDYSNLLDKLGKHKTSRGCLYIKKLADVDMVILKKLVTKSFKICKQKLTLNYKLDLHYFSGKITE